MNRDHASKIEFTLRFASALHRFGAPAHRLEDAMAVLSGVLGLKGQFFVTPTAIFASFEHNTGNDTRMLRVGSSELDLGKLSALDGLVDELSQSAVTIDQAGKKLDSILAEPARYGKLLTTVCNALTCACAARFFGGGLREVTAASLIGFLIGIGEIGATFSRRLSALIAPLAATIAALFATAVAMYWPPASATSLRLEV